MTYTLQELETNVDAAIANIAVETLQNASADVAKRALVCRS
jgi:hypothetical protein